MNIKEEIKNARAMNYIHAVEEKFNSICESKKKDICAFINIDSGEWLQQAIEEVGKEIRNGEYDNMLMPVNNNL